MSAPDAGSDIEALVRKVQAETRRYVNDLLADNRRLRSLAASVQADRERIEAEASALRVELGAFRERQARLERELADVAAENRHFSEEFVVVEQQNSSLANLYVAMSRLHSTLERGEVLATVIDIVEFLVGCEQVAVFEREGDELVLAAHKGIAPEPWQRVSVFDGTVGRIALAGEAWYAPDGARGPDELTAGIPLRRNGGVTGVLALYRLLPQKGGRLEPIDHELLDLLGTQAALALYCASLASRVD